MKRLIRLFKRFNPWSRFWFLDCHIRGITRGEADSIMVAVVSMVEALGGEVAGGVYPVGFHPKEEDREDSDGD